MQAFSSERCKFDDYVIGFAAEKAAQGRRVAIITLLSIDGSSPRPLGAQMAVAETGEWAGYVSGGCLERAIVSEALDTLHVGQNRIVRYGKGSRYFDLQLPCGSAVDLFFDVTQEASSFAAIDIRLSARVPARMELGLPDAPAQSAAVEYYPPRRLVVAGAGAAAASLGRLASFSGFDVHLLTNDLATAEHSCLPPDRITTLTRSRSAPTIAIDERTAIAFLFHDHDWEERLIADALATDAFYVGAMGSRRTAEKRASMLRNTGVGERQLSRLKAPAGLVSGAKSASDIALSILSEVMAAEQAAQIPRFRLVRDERPTEWSVSSLAIDAWQSFEGRACGI
ncbi:XdhC family protein [Rhizobium sp. CF142]|uniref:XdhC family protein n=1 Tax=Rhizobium sp. CF142 TaxID=1144314 RepID=UPI00026EF7E7|nr:XdhC family protein [Rhizobium sp. CF142]EJJ28815.1 xanthine and CO dehydrogenases maturation factor, XdhC/CoxF family [Rhizobium sp. CF142]